MSKGSLVIDEIIIPIRDIYLEGGRIVFVADIHGPARASKSGKVKVFDRSGNQVIESPNENAELTWSSVPAGATFTITYDLTVESITPR